MHSVTLGFVNWDKEAQKAVQRLEGMQEPPQKQQQQQPGLLAVVMVVDDGRAEKTRLEDAVSAHPTLGKDSGISGGDPRQLQEGGDEETTLLLASAVVHGSSNDQLQLGTIYEVDSSRVVTIDEGRTTLLAAAAVHGSSSSGHPAVVACR